MRVLFSDHEPYVAEWLRNLYPDAEIREQDIAGLTDLEGYDRVHLFAGIGGWEYALQLAGWTGPAWTGSCPCQPFSAAGKRLGTADARHLWPEFRRLIAECRPPVVFGEQVASADGRTWLAGVRADLEALGYRFGAADLCAASIGAPHIRQRLFWVADTEHDGRDRAQAVAAVADELGANGRLHRRGAGGLEHAASDGRRERRAESGGRGTEPRCGIGGVGNADDTRPQGRVERGHGAGERTPRTAGLGFWDDYDLIPCGDGKARRIESGTFPLAHGVPNRVGRLRAYGNAIVPQVAAEFIRAYMEAQ